MPDLHIISGAIGSRREVTRLAMCHGVNLLSGCGICCGLRIQIPYNIEPGIILEIFSGIKYFHEINQLVDTAVSRKVVVQTGKSLRDNAESYYG